MGDLHFGTFLAYLCSGGPSKMTSMFTKYGKYPREYNPKVHGPYWPGRYYGKPDTKFADVKLGDLFSWIARRDKGVAPTWQMVHRGYWNWVRKMAGERAQVCRASPSYNGLFYHVLLCMV